MFEQIIEASKGKQIVMFLDYDGTLSPIVDDPDRAFMSKKVKPLSLLTLVFDIWLEPLLLKLHLFLFKLDESNSEKAGQVFPNCYSEWEMQRQGTFQSNPKLFGFLLLF